MRMQPSGLGVLGGPNVLGEVFTSRTGPGAEFDANMAAIVNYFNAATPKTGAAAKVKDDFAKWYADLSYLDTHWRTDDTYVKARNYRDDFNHANATTAAETAAVDRVIKTGVTTEQTWGEPPKARTTSGRYATESEPTVPTYWKIALAVVAGGAVLLFAYGAASALPGAILGRKKAHAPNARSRRRTRNK